MKRIDIEPRPDWKDKAREVGFGFHSPDDEAYWTDDAAYVFTMDQVENEIEEPTRQLHDMCIDTVERIIDDEQALRSLHIPEKSWDLVRASWKNGDRHLYGRFDLAYDGTGPAKMLEYNADTPTSIFEAGFFQHNWMIDQREAGRLPEDVDQYNYIQESLVEAFARYDKDVIFHFSCWTENIEDKGTVSYLMDCAVEAGHSVKMVDIRRIGVDAQGRLTDEDDLTIGRCFKLYPWEDLLRERYARHIRPGQFVEPAWKSIVSNKGFLAHLWKHNAGHPNLLETSVMGTGAVPATYVRKPFFSREGENVVIVENGRITHETEGDYEGGPCVLQEKADLFRHGDRHAVLGSWVIGDRPCGMGIREDVGVITKDSSLFVPHVILG